jgi:plasmid stabilization system protein ParE
VRARTKVLPEALTQAEEADDWWRHNRLAAPTLFAEELAKALRLLEEQPVAGRPSPRPGFPRLRALLLPRSRYHLYYEHDAEAELVLVRLVWSAVRGRPPRLRR